MGKLSEKFLSGKKKPVIEKVGVMSYFYFSLKKQLKFVLIGGCDR